MANQTFTAQIDAFVATCEKRFTAVFRESTERVIDDMQKPGYSVASVKKAIRTGLKSKARGKNKAPVQGPVYEPGGGGNLPVDTGFLRASLMVSTSAMPLMSRENPGNKVPYDGSAVSLVIAGADIGQTIHAGYSAKYAAAVNYGARGSTPRRFVELAAQKWPAIVDQVVAEVKSKIG